MIITYDMLKEHRACELELRMFAKIWPDGAELTMENLRIAWEEGLNLNWLCGHFLISPAWSDLREKLNVIRSNYASEILPYQLQKQEAQNKAYQENTEIDEQAFNEYFATVNQASQDAADGKITDSEYFSIRDEAETKRYQLAGDAQQKYSYQMHQIGSWYREAIDPFQRNKADLELDAIYDAFMKGFVYNE